MSNAQCPKSNVGNPPEAYYRVIAWTAMRQSEQGAVATGHWTLDLGVGIEPETRNPKLS